MCMHRHIWHIRRLQCAKISSLQMWHFYIIKMTTSRWRKNEGQRKGFHFMYRGPCSSQGPILLPVHLAGDLLLGFGCHAFVFLLGSFHVLFRIVFFNEISFQAKTKKKKKKKTNRHYNNNNNNNNHKFTRFIPHYNPI